MKPRNGSNYVHLIVSPGFSPSKTVPDMSLSLRDLLNRHNAGGTVKTFSPVFLPADSIIPDNFEYMSRIDRQDLLNKLPDFIKRTRDSLVSARQKRKDDAIAAKAAAEVSRYEEMRKGYGPPEPIDVIVGG